MTTTCLEGSRKGQIKSYPCNEQSCHKRCKHGCCKWGKFGACTHSCGGNGRQERVCLKGEEGETGKKEERSCNWHDCPPKCINDCCVWSDWSKCSKTCGGGTATRSCLEGPRHGEIEKHKCNEHTCHIDQCKIGCCRWGSWSRCSTTCGGGFETRSCLDGAHKGKTEKRSCSWWGCPTPTPTPKICRWPKWSECSVTCGTGEMTKICEGGLGAGDTKTKQCRKPPCPKLGGCKEWNPWSKCGVSCLRCRCCADAPDYNPPRPGIKV